jgi:glycosyltransferase involved in cell wall biosynthesis
MASARRFAIVSPNFYPRVCGIGDHSARLGDELQRRGHAVAVFSRGPAGPNPETPALEVHGIDGAFSLTVAERIRRAVREWRATDLILQYTSQMWDAWRFGTVAPHWLAALTRSAGMRVTLIAHELFVPWLARPDLFLATVIQRAQFAAIFKACDHVFVTTASRARYLEPACRILGLPFPDVLRVGANALPVNGSSLFSKGESSAPRLGVFSTAAVGKRFDVVLDAFTIIAREFPSAKLVIIGDLGPPEAPRVKDILEVVRKHPDASRIELTGRLSLTEVARQVASLDVYLFPMSTGANTRSGTLPVALGAGLPVIAIQGVETDTSLFISGENVVFAEQLTGSAFGRAALALLRDRTRMAEVGAGARRLHDERLSWTRIVDELLAKISRCVPFEPAGSAR